MEYQRKYLADEVAQCFTVEEFVALCACLIVQLDATLPCLASGKATIVFAGFAFSLFVGAAVDAVSNQSGFAINIS